MITSAYRKTSKHHLNTALFEIISYDATTTATGSNNITNKDESHDDCEVTSTTSSSSSSITTTTTTASSSSSITSSSSSLYEKIDQLLKQDPSIVHTVYHYKDDEDADHPKRRHSQPKRLAQDDTHWNSTPLHYICANPHWYDHDMTYRIVKLFIETSQQASAELSNKIQKEDFLLSLISLMFMPKRKHRQVLPPSSSPTPQPQQEEEYGEEKEESPPSTSNNEKEPPLILQQRNMEMGGALPIHIACRNVYQMNVRLIDYMIECYPDCVFMTDKYNGNLPIHEICISCHNPIIHSHGISLLPILTRLLRLWPDSCYTRNIHGYLPIHLAIQPPPELLSSSFVSSRQQEQQLLEQQQEQNYQLEIVQYLLERNPDTLHIPNKYGSTVVQIATNHSMESYYQKNQIYDFIIDYAKKHPQPSYYYNTIWNSPPKLKKSWDDDDDDDKEEENKVDYNGNSKHKENEYIISSLPKKMDHSDANNISNHKKNVTKWRSASSVAVSALPTGSLVRHESGKLLGLEDEIMEENPWNGERSTSGRLRGGKTTLDDRNNSERGQIRSKATTTIDQNKNETENNNDDDDDYDDDDPLAELAALDLYQSSNNDAATHHHYNENGTDKNNNSHPYAFVQEDCLHNELHEHSNRPIGKAATKTPPSAMLESSITTEATTTTTNTTISVPKADDSDNDDDSISDKEDRDHSSYSRRISTATTGTTGSVYISSDDDDDDDDDDDHNENMTDEIKDSNEQHVEEDNKHEDFLHLKQTQESNIPTAALPIMLINKGFHDNEEVTNDNHDDSNNSFTTGGTSSKENKKVDVCSSPIHHVVN